MMRSRSRWYGERVGASGSGWSRPRLVAGCTAYGARVMRLRLTPRRKRLQFRRENPYLTGMEQFAVTDRAAARIAEIIAAQANPQ